MKQELQVIMDLMKDLQDKMEYGEDDFNDRLGRKKPEVEVMKVGVSPTMDDKDMPDGMDDMDGDEGGMEEEMSPEDKLKDRLMKLRG